ncbi:MAG: hypothetical protein C0505_16905 [Leptothrix sp. (in: Bacteria)]|nr:hypothetical protein [Leptothrix sp. (in: b-proteobacteria)]
MTPVILAANLALPAGVLAQGPPQVVKPPLAQAWIDVATGAGLGMPGLGAGGIDPMAMIGGLFGRAGGGGGNRFGQTQTAPGGRWVDVTLYTRNNPQLAEADQQVPAGFLVPALKLQSPKENKGSAPEPGDDKVVEPTEQERPKGRLLLYWGCGETVRAGQPRVVDFATVTPADLARFFQARRATQRGAHSAVGRPVWPSPDDARLVPEGATLAGEHAFSGAGVPEGFRFRIPPAQDLMPPIQLRRQDQGGATRLEWDALPTARAYFIAGMGGGAGRGEAEMVIWTSSEQPDTGFGLLDYQTNAAVDRWLKEQVLLAPKATACTVPKGVFPGQGAMLRMIAYGSELNLAHPPRPTDPKVPWEPQWAVKLRVKSQTMAMLGMDMSGMPGAPGSEREPEKKEEPKPGVKDLLKGIFGR